MAGHQVGARFAGQAGQQVVGPVHTRQVSEDRERPVAFDLLVEVQRVGGEHHPGVAGADGHDQLPRRVAADLGRLDAGRDGVLAGYQREPALPADGPQQRELVRLHVRGELGAAAERAGPEVVLGLADDDLRGGELAQVPDVVPVRVCHHHGGHGAGVDAEPGQDVRGGGEPGAATAVSGRRGEASVDECDGAVAVADDPEVIVDLLLPVRLAVQVVVEEAFRACGDPVPVPDSEHLARAVAGHAAAATARRTRRGSCRRGPPRATG